MNSDSKGFLARLKSLFRDGGAEPAEGVPEPPYGAGSGELPPGCEEVEEISCQEAARRVYEFLDGELPPEEADRVRCHVEKCRRCYPFFNWEESFLRLVRECVDREEEASPKLKRELQNMLDGLEASGG